MRRSHSSLGFSVRRSRGFSIIELLVTIAIAAVLASVAVPSMQALVAGNRLKSHAAAMQGSLLVARTEAIKRKVRVVVCKSADQMTCSATGDWQQGWIVFVDTNDSAAVDAGEAILEKVPALTGAFVLRGAGDLDSYVSFSSSGAAKLTGSDTSFQTGVMTVCPVGGGESRTLEVFATGRVNSSKTTVSSCSV